MICLHNGTVLTGFSAMEQCAVMMEDGLVSDVYSQKRFEKRHFDSDVQIIDVEGCYIAPGFIDTHIHGIGGFGTEDPVYDSNGDPAATGMEATLRMSEQLAVHGVTAFNPTLYPSEPDLMLETVKAISSCIGKEQGARIMGCTLKALLFRRPAWGSKGRKP